MIQDFEDWNCTGKFLVICISRLEISKMVDHAIRAVSTLRSAGVDFKLVLVGDGRELMSLKLLAEDEGLADNVIFAGNRSQSWISGALTHININLAPLCGRSLLEASLAGCAAIAYDIDWHSEIVISGETGYLVPALDFREMGQKTLELYRNPTLCNTLGANMYEAAKRFARPASIAEKQLQLYKSLVDSST